MDKTDIGILEFLLISSKAHHSCHMSTLSAWGWLWPMHWLVPSSVILYYNGSEKGCWQGKNLIWGRLKTSCQHLYLSFWIDVASPYETLAHLASAFLCPYVCLSVLYSFPWRPSQVSSRNCAGHSTHVCVFIYITYIYILYLIIEFFFFVSFLSQVLGLYYLLKSYWLLYLDLRELEFGGYNLNKQNS